MLVTKDRAKCSCVKFWSTISSPQWQKATHTHARTPIHSHTHTPQWLNMKHEHKSIILLVRKRTAPLRDRHTSRFNASCSQAHVGFFFFDSVRRVKCDRSWTRCCGSDVLKNDIVACLKLKDKNASSKHLKKFFKMPRPLLLCFLV